MAIAYVRLVGVNLITAWPSENAAERWLIPIFAVAALYYFWHEFRHAGEASFAPVFTWFAVVAALCWLCLELDRPYIAIAWGALALVLLVVGLRNKLGAFRWQAYVVFALSAGCCVFINFAEFVDTSAFARTFGASLLIALLFAGRVPVAQRCRRSRSGREARQDVVLSCCRAFVDRSAIP